MTVNRWCAAVLFVCAASAAAADFATPGGPLPGNIDEVTKVLRRDAYDMELLISFGTSKGGSAGHLALAIRDAAGGDDTVYSANFYADRSPEHATDFYTENLMTMIPKTEYLFGTASSLGDKASFGLDFGEVYKRSVIGVRVYGVPAAEKKALVAFFQRVNDDYHRRAASTEYHDDEITYGYMNLNCAKTVGAGFRFGAGYQGLEVKNGRALSRLRVVAATTANLPTEMAIKLLKEWNARGYVMDMVLYRKYQGSTYVDPHDDRPVAFKDLPNRFPSVLSLDFRADEGHYEDADNLYAMYVLYNMGRYSVKVNDETRLLEIEKSQSPMPYQQADASAMKSAIADSKGFLRRRPFRARGAGLGATTDNTQRYEFTNDGKTARPVPD